jgi:uncharacterized protein involved in exopolysaccharide biosynthesis
MNMAIDITEKQPSLNDYWRILQRRRKQFLIPAIAILALCIIAALLWPAKYRSSATILIEEQEIPRDMVPSTITSYANQQIQVITQRTMTLANVMSIVEKYQLLDEVELKRTPRSEIMKDFQKDMGLELVSAEVMDPRIGRPMEATIAFKLSFDHRDPEIARKVTNELVSLYLNENLKNRTEKAATTSLFLKSEADALNQRIRALEQELSEFKQANEGALPELYQYNLNVIERTDAELRDTKSRLAELTKRRLELQSNLAQLSPYAPTALPNGELVLGEQDRLRALESELRSKRALYSDNHPDIQRLQREVDTLRRELGTSVEDEQHLKRLHAEQEKLAQLQRTYNADHPQVQQQQRLVNALSSSATRANTGNKPRADNPAYVLLDTQIRAIEAESAVLEQRAVDLKAKLERIESYLAKAPEVEKRYQELTRDLSTTTLKYQEIMAKQMQAELARNLETERKGERFTLIEPPIRPDEPVSPNRIAIMLVGFLLAGLCGGVSVVLTETMDESVRGEHDLFALLSSTPLVTIPLLTASDGHSRRSHHLLLISGGGIGLLILTLILIHYVYKPLDVLWFIALRKLGI